MVECHENFISVRAVYREISPGFSLSSGIRHLGDSIVESSKLITLETSHQYQSESLKEPDSRKGHQSLNNPVSHVISESVEESRHRGDRQ